MIKKSKFILFMFAFGVFLSSCASKGEINIVTPEKDLKFSMGATQANVALNVQLQNTYTVDVPVDITRDGEFVSTCLVPASSIKSCDGGLPITFGEHDMRIAYKDQSGNNVTKTTHISWVAENTQDAAASTRSISTIAVNVAIAFLIVCVGLMILSPGGAYFQHTNVHKGTDTIMSGFGFRGNSVAKTIIERGHLAARADYEATVSDQKALDTASRITLLTDPDSNK